MKWRTHFSTFLTRIVRALDMREFWSHCIACSLSIMSEEDWKAALSSSERLSTNFCMAFSNASLLTGTGVLGDFWFKDSFSAACALAAIEDLDNTLLGAVMSPGNWVSVRLLWEVGCKATGANTGSLAPEATDIAAGIEGCAGRAWLEAAPGPGGDGAGGAGTEETVLGSLERLNTVLTLPNRPLKAGCEGDGLGPFGGWPSRKPLIFFPAGILSRGNYRLWGLYALCVFVVLQGYTHLKFPFHGWIRCSWWI